MLQDIPCECALQEQLFGETQSPLTQPEEQDANKAKKKKKKKDYEMRISRKSEEISNGFGNQIPPIQSNNLACRCLDCILGGDIYCSL
jgi:hypothetical protein